MKASRGLANSLKGVRLLLVRVAISLRTLRISMLWKAGADSSETVCFRDIPPLVPTEDCVPMLSWPAHDSETHRVPISQVKSEYLGPLDSWERKRCEQGQGDM